MVNVCEAPVFDRGFLLVGLSVLNYLPALGNILSNLEKKSHT